MCDSAQPCLPRQRQRRLNSAPNDSTVADATKTTYGSPSRAVKDKAKFKWRDAAEESEGAERFDWRGIGEMTGCHRSAQRGARSRRACGRQLRAIACIDRLRRRHRPTRLAELAIPTPL